MSESQRSLSDGGGQAARRRLNFVWIIGAVLLVAVLVVAAVFLWQSDTSKGPTATDQAAAQQSKDEGIGLFNSGKIGESIPLLEAYLKADPDDAQARATLAMAYTALSQPEKAAAQYEAILKKSPLDAPTLYRIGLLKRQLDEPGESVKYLEQAVAADEENPTFRAELAKAYSAQQQYSEALEQWVATLDLTPPRDRYRGNIHGQIGDIYLELDQPAKARTSYRTGLTFDPDNKHLRDQLAAIGE